MTRTILALVFVGALPVLAQSEAPVRPEVKAANQQADALERRIREGDPALPALKTDYDLPGGSEGIPPRFVFHFEWKRDAPGVAVLRVCKVHVGREVFSVDTTYFFDEEGRPLKYLRVDSGIAGDASVPPSRAALFFDKQGRVVWTSKDLTPALPFKKIVELFQSLRAASKAFE